LVKCQKAMYEEERGGEGDKHRGAIRVNRCRRVKEKSGLIHFSKCVSASEKTSEKLQR
jgi:hypothetical protein